MTRFSGAYTALVTPFKDGEVDYSSLKKLVRFQLDHQIDGFVVNGTTGESPTLTQKERIEILEFVRGEVAGHVPVIMGTGSNSTAAAVSATKQASEILADAALVVVPYYNKPPQRGLYKHFEAVSQSSDLPLILYNVPSRTVASLEVETVFELSRLSTIVGLKEATGDIEFAKKIIQSCGVGFDVMSGDDLSFLELVRVGGTGVISVASHLFPRQFSDWCQPTKGAHSSNASEFERLKDLIAYLYVESSPIPLKSALCIMGLISSPELRLPLVKLEEPHLNQLKKKMEVCGLI